MATNAINVGHWIRNVNRFNNTVTWLSMRKSLLDHISTFIYRRIKHTEIMSKNMRKPETVILSHIAKRIMFFANQTVIEDSVTRLGISFHDVVIEIGSGNGQALAEIKKHKPAKIYAVEISKAFRKDLQSRFKGENITIIGNDASDLADVIPDKTVNKIILINVIYFLDPLDTYLEEFKRILKPDGFIFFACRFGPVGGFDPKIFKNTDLEEILPSLKKYFSVSSKYIDSVEKKSRYHAIQLTNREGG